MISNTNSILKIRQKNVSKNGKFMILEPTSLTWNIFGTDEYFNKVNWK
jgi:hypothetical protein